MFDWIIDASLKQRLLVLALSLVLIFYGGLSIKQMPVDVLIEDHARGELFSADDVRHSCQCTGDEFKAVET